MLHDTEPFGLVNGGSRAKVHRLTELLCRFSYAALGVRDTFVRRFGTVPDVSRRKGVPARRGQYAPNGGCFAMRTVLVSLYCAVVVAGAAISPADARTRTYYIAADELVWNYAPSGRDLIDNAPLP